LGVDSISGIEIIHDINRQFKIDLDTIIIYNYPTIEDLSEYIANNCNVLQLKTPVEKVKEEHNLVRTKMVLVKKESKKVVMEEKSPNKIGLKLKKKAIVQPEKKEGTDVKKTENNNSKERDGIAVIGMSGRFPGAKNLSEFWDNLCQGVCSISEIPKERWDNSKYYETDITVPNKTYCNRGGFLTGIDEFDPELARDLCEVGVLDIEIGSQFYNRNVSPVKCPIRIFSGKFDKFANDSSSNSWRPLSESTVDIDWVSEGHTSVVDNQDVQSYLNGLR